MVSARGNNAQTTKIEEELLGENSYKYTYDKNGNITAVLLKKSTETTYSKYQQFAYDELNQLVRADDLAKNRTEVYNYDNGGNILSVTTYPLTWGSLSGVTATDTTAYTYGDSNWKDKLTSFNGREITYDEIGNPLKYKNYNLTWQNGRQLASMQLMQMRWEFTYDVDGLRTSKKITNVDLIHDYYYVGSRLEYEMVSDGSALWYFYDADGNPSGIRYKNGSTTNDYYFVCNWRGDVIQIYNASGTLVGSYDYDAWGKVTENATSADTQGITETNPIRYRGYYYDTDTRLYYVNSRYYDPIVKRFVSSDDSIISTATPEALTDKNLFVYCDNNPVTRSDGEGNIWHIVVGAVIGGALNSIDEIINVVNTYRSGGSDDEKTKAWLHLGISFTTGAISGGLSMTGVGVVASISINTAISLGDEALDQFIDGEINARNLIVAGVEGVIGGVSGGDSTKAVTKAGKETIRKTSTTFRKVYKSRGLRAAAKAYKGKAAKQATRYLKNNRFVSKKLLKNSIKSVFSTIVKAIWNKIRKR